MTEWNVMVLDDDAPATRARLRELDSGLEGLRAYFDVAEHVPDDVASELTRWLRENSIPFRADPIDPAWSVEMLRASLEVRAVAADVLNGVKGLRWRVEVRPDDHDLMACIAVDVKRGERLWRYRMREVAVLNDPERVSAMAYRVMRDIRTQADG